MIPRLPRGARYLRWGRPPTALDCLLWGPLDLDPTSLASQAGYSSAGPPADPYGPTVNEPRNPFNSIVPVLFIVPQPSLSLPLQPTLALILTSVGNCRRRVSASCTRCPPRSTPGSCITVCVSGRPWFESSGRRPGSPAAARLIPAASEAVRQTDAAPEVVALACRLADVVVDHDRVGDARLDRQRTETERHAD